MGLKFPNIIGEWRGLMFRKALVLGAALSGLTACDPVALGIGSGIVLLNTAPVLDDARKTTALTNIRQLEASVEMYQLRMLEYPTQEQGLEALVSPPDNLKRPERYPKGGFIQELIPDPWGRPYQYRRVGNSYVIFSFGADGAEGGEGLNADIFSDSFRVSPDGK